MCSVLPLHQSTSWPREHDTWSAQTSHVNHQDSHPTALALTPHPHGARLWLMIVPLRCSTAMSTTCPSLTHASAMHGHPLAFHPIQTLSPNRSMHRFSLWPLMRSILVKCIIQYTHNEQKSKKLLKKMHAGIVWIIETEQ